MVSSTVSGSHRKDRLVAEVCDRYREGESIRIIAVGVGSCYSSVRNMLVNNGVVLRPPVTPKRQDDRALVEQACARYRQGESIRIIAAGLGRSRRTVGRMLVDNGVAVRSNSVAQKVAGALVDPICGMYVDEGMDIETIAARLDVAPSFVWTTLKKAGVKRRRGGWVPVSVSPQTVSRVKTLYCEEGLTVPEIAAELGTYRQKVSRALALAGVRAKGGGGPGCRPRRTNGSFKCAGME